MMVCRNVTFLVAKVRESTDRRKTVDGPEARKTYYAFCILGKVVYLLFDGRKFKFLILLNAAS